MTVQNEITRLAGAKADLKTAIEAKGVTVPEEAGLESYPALVEQISTGIESLDESTPTTLNGILKGNGTSLGVAVAGVDYLGPQTGTQGQVLGFTADNVVGAIDAPTGGLTQEQADARYLQLSGGAITGPITSPGGWESISLEEENGIIISGDMGVVIRSGSTDVISVDSGGRLTLGSSGEIVIDGTGTMDVSGPMSCYSLILETVPTSTKAAVNKGYVDDALASHTQGASTITAGTLGGEVQANATAAATLGNAQVRNIYAGTEDLAAGTSALATGTLYFVYE